MQTNHENTAAEVRDLALDAVDAAAPEIWKIAAKRVLCGLVASKQAFSTDDVWAALPQPPEPRAIGALIMAAAKSGQIRRVGWKPSERRACHARPVAIWTGQ